MMPLLTTDRLIIRPFVREDLAAIHRILDVELAATAGGSGTLSLEARRRWLEWTVLGYEQLAHLNQPPYGERAILLKEEGRLIGAVGFVPCLDAFHLLPGFENHAPTADDRRTSTEFGLFYALAPAYQRQGYATEAAAAMVAFAFDQLKLRRVVATTTHENRGSIGVMKRLGMRILRNPHSDPPWLQVVGVLMA